MNHPSAILIDDYNKPYLYCLNTSIKKIFINNIIFSDWDDVYNIDIHNIINDFIKIYVIQDATYKMNDIDIHKYLDSGFHCETKIKLLDGNIKQIKDINIGDILENGEIVYGLVEINGKDIYKQFEYYLGNEPYETIIGSSILMYSIEEGMIIHNDTLDKKETFKEDKLYHLLTNTGVFTIYNVQVYDYNASIDLILENCNKIYYL
jgi:hypothetical protein